MLSISLLRPQGAPALPICQATQPGHRLPAASSRGSLEIRAPPIARLRRGTATSAHTTVEPVIVQMGTDHTIAPLALRERLALGDDAASAFLLGLIGDPLIGEAALLSTCNRVEVYVATNSPDRALPLLREALARVLDEEPEALEGVLVGHEGTDAVRHLCGVAAGLHSMIVAEGQILGQVKDALDMARQLGTAGPYLGAAFRAAVACGKRVRTETALGRTDVSASSVLVDLLAGEIEEWADQRVLLIGAGRMSQLTAARLAALGAGSIAVSSRTMAAAARLADAVGGKAVPLDAVPAHALDATLIISATRSTDLMLTAAMLTSRPHTPLIAVDLAVPRDIDPAVADLPGVRLLDIDDLRHIQDRQGLGAAVSAAIALVEVATAEWQVWCRTREAVPLIADLRAHVDAQKEAELARALKGLEHLSDRDRAEVAEMAHRLVNKMFHHLAIRMKQAAADPELGAGYLEAARYLFQRDDRSPHSHPPPVPADALPVPAHAPSDPLPNPVLKG